MGEAEEKPNTRAKEENADGTERCSSCIYLCVYRMAFLAPTIPCLLFCLATTWVLPGFLLGASAVSSRPFTIRFYWSPLPYPRPPSSCVYPCACCLHLATRETVPMVSKHAKRARQTAGRQAAHGNNVSEAVSFRFPRSQSQFLPSTARS